MANLDHLPLLKCIKCGKVERSNDWICPQCIRKYKGKILVLVCDEVIDHIPYKYYQQLKEKLEVLLDEI